MDTKSLARWLIVLLAILGLVFALAEVGQSWNDSKKETEQVRVEKDKVQQELEQLDDLYQKLKISKTAKSTPIESGPTPTKVAAKAPPTPPKPAVVSSIGKCEQYREEVAKYPWNVDIVLQIMKAESGCNPNAVSPTNDHGLMQLHNIPIYDPAENIAYAYNYKYMKGGFVHWTVCTNGIVNCW